MALRYDKDLSMPDVNSNEFWYLPYSKEPGNFEAVSIAGVWRRVIAALLDGSFKQETSADYTYF